MPTVWQKATVALLSLGCILLIANLFVTVLGQSSRCSLSSSTCPQRVSRPSAEPVAS
jgi:hypothetical protein